MDEPKEVCVCGHPKWAHQVNNHAGSEETGVWTTTDDCNWDIDGPKCECPDYKAKPDSSGSR